MNGYKGVLSPLGPVLVLDAVLSEKDVKALHDFIAKIAAPTPEKSDWCERCGCGNDKAGFAHLDSCPTKTHTPEVKPQWWVLVSEYDQHDVFACRVCKHLVRVDVQGVPLPEECPNCNDRPAIGIPPVPQPVPTPPTPSDEPGDVVPVLLLETALSDKDIKALNDYINGNIAKIPHMIPASDEPVVWVDGSDLKQLRERGFSRDVLASLSEGGCCDVPLYTHPASDELRKAAEALRDFVKMDVRWNHERDRLLANLDEALEKAYEKA